MCLIVFAYKVHPDYKLVLAANRDEFYERPTTTAHWWGDYPTILGGRDLEAGGTWMGVDKYGKFAAVTNYRDPANIRTNVKSRGDLPVNFLIGKKSSSNYSEDIVQDGENYNGFNLLCLDDEMVHLSNYENKTNVLSPGVYGLSNALLDTSWPKVDRSKEKFGELLNTNFDLDSLISMMQDEEVARDEMLPQTGLSLEMERAVSPMCIRTESYGTCCSTAILVGYDGNISFQEKSYAVGSRKEETNVFTFKAVER